MRAPGRHGTLPMSGSSPPSSTINHEPSTKYKVLSQVILPSTLLGGSVYQVLPSCPTKSAHPGYTSSQVSLTYFIRTMRMVGPHYLSSRDIRVCEFLMADLMVPTTQTSASILSRRRFDCRFARPRRHPLVVRVEARSTPCQREHYLHKLPHHRNQRLLLGQCLVPTPIR